MSAPTHAAPAAVPVSEERRSMVVAGGAHALHDGYTDLIYVMLPIWQAEFGLSYAVLGLMKTMFSLTLAGLQIPSGRLAERFGVPIVLALGTALAGIGFCIAGLSQGIALLMAALVIGGVGSSTQHPLASALVARAYAGPRSLKALGTYNFAGDLGKMTLPVAGSLLMIVMPWRPMIALLGGLGVLAAIVIYVAVPRFSREAPPPAKSEGSARGAGRFSQFGFPLLLSVGVLDSATRMAFLTFLPFVLAAKGASVPTIGLALTLVFTGGAAGKLACAFLGARIGAVATVWVTETATALGMAVLLKMPLEFALLLLPLVGIALNGTSSVLYGSVPDLVEPERRARAFGIFYTGTIGAGAISPAIYGLLGDAVGVPAAFLTVAGMVLLTLPITLALRPALPHA